MGAHPVCDVIGRLLGTLVAVNDLGLQFGDEHAILANVARGVHVWNVLDQKIAVADFEMKPGVTKCKQVLATSD
jgi:hypothetical protein